MMVSLDNSEMWLPHNKGNAKWPQISNMHMIFALLMENHKIGVLLLVVGLVVKRSVLVMTQTKHVVGMRWWKVWA